MLETRVFSFRNKRFAELLARDVDFEAEALAAAVAGEVRVGGGEALLRRICQHDFLADDLAAVRVDAGAMEGARGEVSDRFLSALALARVNLRRFHEYQRRRGYQHDDGDGVKLSRRTIPLSRVGICCGDSFSALLMCAIPAQVAGVGEIVCAAPPRGDGSVDPHYLAAARALGIDEVYRMSGAHAVAAMAYGAGVMRRVDKIVGPGGAEAEAAKRMLSGVVGVDGPAGVQDLAVLADAGANARFIAADFLAQAGMGDGGGAAVLFTTDRLLAEAVRIELERMIDDIPEAERARRALSERGAIFVCRSLEEAVGAVNEMAPARLVLMTADDEAVLGDIERVGAVYLGPWSGEVAGDALVGVNQLLPGGGAARFSSGLGVSDFVREMTIVEYSAARLAKTGRHITMMAEVEGGAARADAVRERMDVLKLAL